MTFKPMLASAADLSKLRFPVLASPKFDGIRCVVLDGKALTRNLKPIPNDYTRGRLEAFGQAVDGEIVVGDPRAKDCFQRTTSAIMSKDGQPEFTFHAFDLTNVPSLDFETRLGMLAIVINGAYSVRGVPHTLIRSLDALNAYEAQLVEQGWEGVMLRDPKGFYKHGRSTPNEGGLLKLKRFADAEATIVGFEERMHNANAATVDALGHTERSTHKAGMVPLGDLGALAVEWNGQRFTIGSGFTAEQRKDFWTARSALLGELVKFRYQEIGTKDAPRFPVFVGFRDARDT